VINLKAFAFAIVVGVLLFYPLFYGWLWLGIFSMHGDGHIEVLFALEFIVMMLTFWLLRRWLVNRAAGRGSMP
jgi:hypothetical protein